MIKIKNLTNSSLKIMSASGEVIIINNEDRSLCGKSNQNTRLETVNGKIPVTTPMLDIPIKVDTEQLACADRGLLDSLPEPDLLKKIYIVPPSYLGIRKDFFVVTEPCLKDDEVIYTSITTAA